MLTSEKTILPETWGGEMRALLTIGIPMALAQFVHYSVYIADTVMLGRVGAEELAAAAIGTIIYFLLWMLGAGPASAVTPLVSQALGRDKLDTRDPRRTVRMAIWISFLMLPPLVLILFFVEPLLVLLGQNPDVAARAKIYIIVLAPGLPFALAVSTLRNFLATIGKTMVPFLLVSLGSLINIFLNYILIFGKFGAPEMGLIGAGIASSFSYALGFLFFVIYISWDKRAKTFDLFQRFFVPDWERFREVVKLGWPISVTITFEGMLFNAAGLIVGAIGVSELAGYQVALSFASAAFMLPFGMAMAGAVRIGLAQGANNAPAKRRASTTTITACVILIMVFAIPAWVSPDSIAGLYIDESNAATRDVFNWVILFLPLAAGFMFFDAVQVAANQLLRGLSDVKWPMFITGISYWLIGFPVAFYLALHTDVGAPGVWYGLMVALIAAFIGLGIRLWLQLRQLPLSGPQA